MDDYFVSEDLEDGSMSCLTAKPVMEFSDDHLKRIAFSGNTASLGTIG
jgi:hypothetical protein